MDTYIHPTAEVGPNVVIGKGCYIGPFCYIEGDTTIGDNNHFMAHCSIGTAPEQTKAINILQGKVPNLGTYIGNGNTFREFTTVNAGANEKTAISNNCIFLRGSHVGHDAQIGNRVIVSCNVIIGGHCEIMRGANLGLGAVIHQYRRVGEFAMAGMGAIVTKDIPPGETWVGNPARYLSDNIIGIERGGVTQTDIRYMRKSFDA